MADVFTWNPTVVGSFDNPLNWTDTTTPSETGTVFPGSADTAEIVAGAMVQTIDGPGAPGTLDLGSGNILVGTFTTGLTSIDAPNIGTSVTVQGGLSASLGLQVGVTSVATLTIASGSTVSAASANGTSEVVLGKSANSSGAITVNANSALVLTGAAETTNYSLLIGSSGTGALVISGSGASVNTVNDPTVVGQLSGSSGTLVVAQGGSFTTASSNSNDNAALADGRLGTGTVLVTDPGSSITANGAMYVGRSAFGIAEIENFGQITAGNTSDVAIGDGNGTASTLSGGTGFLDLTTHGTLNDLGSLVVGGNGASGLATIDNSVVDATGRVLIGVSTTIGTQYLTGNGVIQISDAGTLAVLGAAETFTAVGVGYASLSDGVINVIGSGALLDVVNNLINIGNSGSGTVDVSQGGSVFAASPGPGFAAIVLGDNAGGVGTLLVDGASSVTADGAFTVGFSGSGVADITNGGSVFAETAVIGYNTGATGTVSLSGSGSALLDSGTLSIGASTTGGTGSGLLEIGSGSTVEASSGTIGALGVVDLNGGFLTTSSTLALGAGGLLSGSGTIGGELFDGGAITATGTLDVAANSFGTGSALVGPAGDLIYSGLVNAGLETDFTGAGGRIDLLSPAAFGGIIGGIGTGETIFAEGATSISFAGGSTIDLFGSGGSALGTIALDGSYAATTFLDNGGTITEAPCFVAGTMIDTVAGPVAVEKLRAGMMATAWRSGTGVAAAVRWTGRRRVDLRRHPDPDRVRPVRIARGAFGAGLPARPLVLSPDHAVFVDGVLIPVKHLINGSSIAFAAARHVEYWHVELERHDILHAEGLPVESYLDTGNRAAFENGPTVQLHADFARRGWADACAELVQDGERLLAVKQRLFERARPAARSEAVALRVFAGRTRLVPISTEGGDWRYLLPAGTGTVVLRSPAWVPASRYATSLDRRRLGVRVFGIAVDGRPMRLTDRGLQSGFYGLEETAEGVCRWTDGRARLVLPFGAGEIVLQLRAAEARLEEAA